MDIEKKCWYAYDSLVNAEIDTIVEVWMPFYISSQLHGLNASARVADRTTHG
jgi:hypothetical protein